MVVVWCLTAYMKMVARDCIGVAFSLSLASLPLDPGSRTGRGTLTPLGKWRRGLVGARDDLHVEEG